MECINPGARPVLLASSDSSETELAEAAIGQLELEAVMVLDAAHAVQLLCAEPNRFAAVVVGERVGRASGMTFCGVARDAGLRLPLLLLTGEDCQWTAVRAARLQVAVMWKPAPSWRIAQAVMAMLPRRLCNGGMRRPLATAVGTRSSRGGDADYWRRPRSLW